MVRTVTRQSFRNHYEQENINAFAVTKRVAMDVTYWENNVGVSPSDWDTQNSVTVALSPPLLPPPLLSWLMV